jgi:hypothetical protein
MVPIGVPAVVNHTVAWVTPNVSAACCAVSKARVPWDNKNGAFLNVQMAAMWCCGHHEGGVGSYNVVCFANEVCIIDV